MPLKQYKSLDEIQTANKTKKNSKKERIKIKMSCTDLYEINHRQQQKHTSNLCRESYNTEYLNKNSISDKTDKNEKSHTKKIKPNPQKRMHDSQSYPHKIHSEYKHEKKANRISTRGRMSIEADEYVVKEIPLKEDLLEFPIDQTQCPMVVRVHKGHLNKPRRKQKPEKSHSPVLTHSHSCPPCIEEKFKVTSERKKIQHKKKQKKSKCRLMYYGYTISDFLNLSPRKTREDTTKNNSDKFTDLKKSNISNPKKILIDTSKLQNSCKNERIHVCASVNINDVKKNKHNRKSINIHKISVEEKGNTHNTKLVHIEPQDNDSNISGTVPYSKQFDSNITLHPSVGKQREITSPMGNFKTGCINEHCEKTANQMKQTSLTEKASIAKKNQIYNEPCFLQRHGEGEMLHFIKSENNIMCRPQDCLRLENKERFIIVPENVVTLDASQSQFSKIYKFINNSTSKCNQNISLEEVKLSSSTLNSSLITDDQDCVKKDTKSKIYLHPNDKGRKINVKSEEEHLIKHDYMNNFSENSNNKRYGSFVNPSRYNSPVTNLNSNSHTPPPDLAYEKLQQSNSQSSPYGKCLKCSKDVCEIMKFPPYCSDCNLKAKLSQISKESSCTNSDSELIRGLVHSIKALTTIPKSDSSFPKRLVNVAIQTDCDLETDVGENKKIIVESNTTENKNPSDSLENVFKMHYSMGTLLNNEQGENKSNVKEYLRRNCKELEFDQKEISIPNKNSTLEYQTKGSVSPFVSPIFPEKEYYRITCNDNVQRKNKKSSHENLISMMNNSFDYSLKYKKNPSDTNFKSRYGNESPVCCIQCETSLSGKDKTSAEGCYISYEKRVTFDKEIKNSKRCAYLPKDISLEKDEPLFCEKGKLIAQNKDIFPEFSFSAMNMRDSLISLDNHLKKSTNESYKEHHKTNTRHTLPRAKTHQNLNCTIPCQSLQFPNSTIHVTDFHMATGSKKSINDYQEQGFTTNQDKNGLSDTLEEITPRTEGSNCLQTECPFLNRRESGNSLYKNCKNSKLNLYDQFNRVGNLAEEVNTDHEIVGDHTDSFQYSTKIMDKSEINKSIKGTSEASDEINLHTFSYIFFNISVPGIESDSPDINESYKLQGSSQTGLVLMPNKAGDTQDHELNDIILGSKFKTEVNSRLMSRKETNIHEFNVFELKNFCKTSKIVIDDRSDLQMQNSEKGNLEKKPLMYKVISPSTELNELNETDTRGKINDPDPLEEILNSSPLYDTNFKMNKNHEKIINKALKKNNYLNPMQKKTNPKKTRGKRKKFSKCNDIFMCSYMAQLSFFRFVSGLQTRVCSELKKSKFV